jgi:hypothetical protein
MKIAINLGSKFVAIEAEAVDIHGIPCAVHKGINKPGWSVSSVERGVALISKATSKALAIESARGAVGFRKQDVVLGLAKYPKVPDVATLEDYVKPAKPSAPTINVAAIITAIAQRGGIAEDLVARVICKQGKNRGRLISKCPPVFGPKKDPQAAAVWLGIQPNPFKVSPGKVLFLDNASQELCLRLGQIKWPGWLDADRAALESFGVW